MTKKSIIKNYIYNSIFQILTFFIPLITTPYLSRVLGAENIGVYSYTISITTYFILFGSLGVTFYGQREIAYVQNNIEKRSKAFVEIILMRFITLGISMIIFYFIFCLNGEYSLYYRILLLEIIANSLDISWLFQGLEEFKKTVLRNTFVKLVSTICIFVFVKSSEDLTIYFIIYSVSTLLGNLSLWMYLPKYIKKCSIKEINIFRHIKPTIELFIPQVAIQIYTVLDKTMLGSFIHSKTEVGYYEQAQKIIKLLLTVATSLGTVMIPRIANTFANKEHEKVKYYLNKSFSFILMLAFPLMFGMISISNKFVPIFYGEGYEKVTLLINTISPIIVIISISNIIGKQYLLPTKQQGKYTISVVVGAVINFIFNVILIPKYMSIGASIATIIAELSVVICQLLLVRKTIDIKMIFFNSFKFFIASILMFLASIALNKTIDNCYLSILFQTLVSFFVYVGVLLCLREKFIFECINNLKNKIKSHTM